jgi:peptide/nickel transport system substrate-binding protein
MLAIVARRLLATVPVLGARLGGLTVDMQSMDGRLVSRRAKKEPGASAGWNAPLTFWVAADVLDPISTAGLVAACEDAWFGWPCADQLEQLRLAFA